jgi:hypothetical protein
MMVSENKSACSHAGMGSSLCEPGGLFLVNSKNIHFRQIQQNGLQRLFDML